jgi:hypothetical protein
MRERKPVKKKKKQTGKKATHGPRRKMQKKKKRPPGTLGHLLITKLQDLQDAVLVKCIPCGVKES